jgi:hypothetical protein
MSAEPIAAVVYPDGRYPDRLFARVLEPLRKRGIALVGALQLESIDVADRHPCDLLLENLSTGEIVALAEHRGRQARGCRLDIRELTGLAERVERSLRNGRPCLLVVNKFGKIEADGGGLRDALAEAVNLGIPALVGVSVRNLDRWRAFAGAFAIELPAAAAALATWLDVHGLSAAAASPSCPEQALAA